MAAGIVAVMSVPLSNLLTSKAFAWKRNLSMGQGWSISSRIRQTPLATLKKKKWTPNQSCLRSHGIVLLHLQVSYLTTSERMPQWLKTNIPMGPNYTRIKENLRDLKLNTVSSIRFLLILGLRASSLSEHWRVLGWQERNCNRNDYGSPENNDR